MVGSRGQGRGKAKCSENARVASGEGNLETIVPSSVNFALNGRSKEVQTTLGTKVCERGYWHKRKNIL